MFSDLPDTRAAFKQNLSPKLSQDIFGEVVQYPGRTLNIVAAEARLTRDEILYLVFPIGDKTGDRKCLTCHTTVNIGGVLYHGKCRTIKWLTQHCHFRYDAEDECLLLPKQIYLAPTRRRLILEILKAHALLKRHPTHTNRN